MKIIKWILIWTGLKLLKVGLRFRIKGEGFNWLQPFKASGQMVNRIEWILKYCQGKKVMHVGFADAPYTKARIENNSLLHVKIKNVASDLFGIDAHEESVRIYKKMTGDELVYAGIISSFPSNQLNKYELILLGELLEHVENPCLLIRQLKEKLLPGQQVLITVPNYISYDSLSAALHKTESIHPDHHWYFSPYTLSSKFNPEYWSQEDLIFGLYGEKRPNFIQQSFPAIADCLIMIFKRK
jgi:hypothetical protein